MQNQYTNSKTNSVNIICYLKKIVFQKQPKVTEALMAIAQIRKFRGC